VNLQFFSIVFLLEEVEEVEILAIRKGHYKALQLLSKITKQVKKSMPTYTENPWKFAVSRKI
jgi:hypothetical protein